MEGLAFVACNDRTVSTARLAHALLDDVAADRTLLPISPHLSRLLPIVHTSTAASVDGLLPPPSQPLLPPSLPSPFTFSVLFRHSNCDAVQRAAVIDAVASRVHGEAKERGAAASVKLVGSDVTVLCWLVKSVAMLGVLDGYQARRQYNIAELRRAARGGQAPHG